VTNAPIPISRFTELYDADADPWGFATRWYEARKYALTLAALPHPRYARAFEPGCAIGVLTAALAARCDYLLAGDAVPVALQQARRRIADEGATDVDLRLLVLPDDWPPGPWDLIVLSEIAYYFDRASLEQLLELIAATTEQGANVIAVHWRGETDYPLSGDAVHEKLRAHPALIGIGSYVEADFVIDVFERRPDPAGHRDR
jgi:protein-L-isoaspartate O-methyltransferase